MTSAKLVCGIPNERKPFTFKLEKGRMRFRFRPESLARVFITKPGGIAVCAIEDRGETWGLGPYWE
jgi:hypothetical protein